MVLFEPNLDTATHATRVLQELLDRRRELRILGRSLCAPRHSRAWTRIIDTDDANAWLIAWDRGSCIDAHDHGGSNAAVHVLRGVLLESSRAIDGDTVDVRRIARGMSVEIPHDRVHAVSNVGRKHALSLHVYSPPLRVMTPHAALLLNAP